MVTSPINRFYDANRVCIVAELSANHRQRKDLAIQTIVAAKKAGADAVKLQTYTPDTITMDCDTEQFRNIHFGTIWEGKTLYDLYKEAYTPWEWHQELFETAKDEGLVCFSTPFDKSAVDFLETLGNPIYKIASFEIQDIPLISYTASRKKPMIISTGIAEREDIALAVKACRDAGNNDITLLKCTSAYPAPVEEANLRTIPDMRGAFDVTVGLSDHSHGMVLPIVAVSLGASMIEKHFIIDKQSGGPDAPFSLDFEEFSAMVKGVREAEKALGDATYDLSDRAQHSRKFGRSLYAVRDVKKGERLTEENVRSIRPAYGLHPRHLPEVLGKEIKEFVPRGTPLAWEHLG